MSAGSDWIEQLTLACEASSQRQVGRLIGYSATTVCQVLAGAYPGDLAAVERAVRSHLDAPVRCPELGEIAAAECRTWQRHSVSFVNSDRLRVRMFAACRRCPLNPGDPR